MNRPTSVKCKFCARIHEYRKERCPAWGKVCTLLELWDSTNTVAWQVDTGATCNELPFKECVRVTGDQNGELLDPDYIRNDAHGGKRINVAGSTNLQFKDLQGKKYSMRIVVVHLDANPLLSLQTSKKLGIISFPNQDVKAVSAKGWLKDDIIRQYEDVFDCLGCLEGTYSIVIDESAKSVIHPPRKIPVSLRIKLKEYLEQLVKDEVLAPVTEATDWVSSMVIVHKPGSFASALIQDTSTMQSSMSITQRQLSKM